MKVALGKIRDLLRNRFVKYLFVALFVGFVIQTLSLVSLSQAVRISDTSVKVSPILARFANLGLATSSFAPHRWPERIIPGESEITRILKMAEATGRALGENPELLQLVLESDNRIELLNLENLKAVSNLAFSVKTELDTIENLALAKPGQSEITQIFGYELYPIIQTGHSALDIAIFLPELFGCVEPTQSLVLLTSPAEARSVGGLIGQYVQLDFNCNSFEVTKVGANSELFDNAAFDQHLAKYPGLYSGVNPEWVNSNLVFDLDSLAPAWQRAYNEQFNQDIDFILVLDTDFLSELLSITGGINAADGTALSSQEEIAAYLENGVYFQFVDDQIARKNHLKDITSDFAQRLSLETLLNFELFDSYFKVLRENQILFYPTGDRVKNDFVNIENVSWSGMNQDTVFVGINNLSGSKFDYYSQTNISIKKCRINQAELKVEISNSADPNLSYPDYVNRRLDGYLNSETGVLNEIILMVPNSIPEFEVLQIPALAKGNWILGPDGYDIYRVVEFISAGESSLFQFNLRTKPSADLKIRKWGQPTLHLGSSFTSRGCQTP